MENKKTNKISIIISDEDYNKLLEIKKYLEKEIGIKLTITQTIEKIIHDSNNI